MTRTITLHHPPLTKAMPRDPRLVSYNVEMAEVTGGTFWKPYTPLQVAGVEDVPQPSLPGTGADADGADGAPAPDAAQGFSMSDALASTSDLMAPRGPIDLANPRLRALAAAIGPSWLRVSGSWATGTYFDQDGRTHGQAPQGYRAVLTRAQWDGVLDFAQATGAKLLVSFAANPKLDNAACRELGGTGAWDPAQVRRLLNYSWGRGAAIAAVEFVNEPNISFLDAPGYVPERYMRDQDAFYRFMRIEFPTVKLVGPCSAMDPIDPDAPWAREGLLGQIAHRVPSAERLAHLAEEKPEAYSYHIYAGISERGASLGHHWQPDQAATDAVLDVADKARRYHERVRDGWCPNAPLWVTESGDANCGGNTWGSTFLDVFRTADELGRFSANADGVIFHNTLASSDYGLLDEQTFAPRPNWWFLWLWTHLAGTGAFAICDATAEPIQPEGVHVYARTRADGQPGLTYLIINNSQAETLDVLTGTPTVRFTLSSPDAPAEGAVTTQQLRTPTMLLNGAPLKLGADDELPQLEAFGERIPVGQVTLQPGTVTFLVA